MKINIFTLIILFMGVNVKANNNTSEINAQIKTMGVGFNNFYKTYQQRQVNGVFSTVGAEGSCDFDSIQDAIDSNADEVRVATNMVYNEILTLTDRDIIIRGGFVTCADANNNNQSSNRSVIDHTGLNLGAIIAISGSNQRSTIVLENLRLTAATFSGIEAVSADAEILLNNMRIDNNHLTLGVGGGIGVFGGDTDFILIDTIISENSAEFGGGILCSGANISFFISGESGVSQNMATGIVLNSNSGNGGGLFVTDDCEVSMYSGTQNTSAQTLIGISGNQAIADGGGLYISQGGKVLLSGHRSTPNGGIDFFGDDSKPVNLNNNTSDLNNLGYGGGGAFVTDTDSFLIINGGLIKDNVSSNGGGIFSQNDAILFITRLENDCWDSDRCNFIQANIAKNNGNGGAVFNDSSRILITNTYFEDNQAGLGTAIYVKNSFSQGDNRIDVDIFNHNSSPTNSLNDKHVIHLEASRMEITHSTFADNDVEEAVIGVDMFSDLRIVTSIIHESSGLAVSGAGGISTVSGCMMVHDITNIAVGRVDDPEFVDRDNRNYHLNPALSPAIDMCSDFAVSAFRDIDFNQRHWDYPNIDNTFGSPMSYSDAGADEVYDIIFKNDFE